MNLPSWITNLPFSITVCDKDGEIIYMNEKSAESFAKYGGKKLIGTDVLDCHPEPSKSKLADMLENETENIYSITKDGNKKMIYQVPWYEEGKYKGFVELMTPAPDDAPNHNRE